MRCLCLFLFLAASFGLSQADYTLFESGPVRPIALSPDGTKLFVANIPDGRLEVFAIVGDGLSLLSSVPVGLEPVSVAARSNTEVWVVNHLSDSVSIVDVATPTQATVRQTLLVGDEPRDIVFAGPNRARAFITCAHRGQNLDVDPQLTTPGVGRADVWVFDADQLGTSLGGDRLTLITLFADTPRALAVSPDGTRVYAAAFFSGNKTTTLSEGVIPDGGEAAGGLPAPNTNAEGVPAPETGLIVRHNGSAWVDELGRDWSSSVRFNLPDKDVFVLDAMASPPVEVATPFSSVGTVLFNMAVHPTTGKVYVTHTEALNEARFEGPGTFAGHTVRGKLHLSRIAILEEGQPVVTRHLNKHIDYNQCCDPIPNEVNGKSLAQPLDLVFNDSGDTLYVAAYGSAKVGVFSVDSLNDDSFVPNSQHIALSGGGPCGLVLSGTRLYVLTRFDNTVTVVDTTTRSELSRVALFNPEGTTIRQGRRFLYDASFTSSHGDQSCGSCHVFGDMDALAWDLGNPDGTVANNLNPFVGPTVVNPDFHPMKGPMTTQSLRGLANHGPMHWRGDRTGSDDAANAQPNSGAFDESAAFKKFNPAFEGLIGRDSELSAADMQAFTDFVLQITYPPNPIRNLDNSLTAAQEEGRAFFHGPPSDGPQNCNACHQTNPDTNPNQPKPGFFGTSGNSSFQNEPQIMKIPHLRNLYQKVGMFGIAPTPFLNPGNNGPMGDQIRGFGYLHDGSIDTLFRFLNAVVFNRNPVGPGGFPPGALGNTLRVNVEAFMLAAETNLAPVLGQQTTLDPSSTADIDARLDLLLARADAGECDLVAQGLIAGESRGYLYNGTDFVPDRADEASISKDNLRSMARTAGATLTFTAVPVGSGTRIGLDRDRDTHLNRDELDAGSNPGNPASVPLTLSETAPLWRSAPLCSTEESTVLDLVHFLNRTCPY